MTGCVVLLGDDLRPLHALSNHPLAFRRIPAPATQTRLHSARAVVLGLDLSEATSVREAKRALRNALHSVTDLRRYGQLVHLCVVYLLPNEVPNGRMRSVAGSVASRLHAALERETGQYVDVALLDVTACEDGVLLADRIMDQIRRSAGSYTDIALSWSDIRDQSITQITVDRYS